MILRSSGGSWPARIAALELLAVFLSTTLIWYFGKRSQEVVETSLPGHVGIGERIVNGITFAIPEIHPVPKLQFTKLPRVTKIGKPMMVYTPTKADANKYLTVFIPWAHTMCFLTKRGEEDWKREFLDEVQLDGYVYVHKSGNQYGVVREPSYFNGTDEGVLVGLKVIDVRVQFGYYLMPEDRHVGADVCDQ